MTCLVLALFLSFAPVHAGNQASSADDAVTRVKSAWQSIQAAVDGGGLRTAQVQIGGGQNPAAITVHYEGGTDADFERDPYAAPFRVRRSGAEMACCWESGPELLTVP